MKRILALVFLFAGIGGVAAGASALTDAGLRHAHIALMPEGEPEDVAVLRPLHPGVVAWGIDAISYQGRPEELRARMQAYRDLGVGLLACNVWMLTATPRVLHDEPQFQDAVCRDIAGDPIVPRWLDGEYQGVKSYWGCTNHPLFREQLIVRARAGIAAGANLLHLDDHLGTAAAAEHSGGCFCAYCMRGFSAWLRENLGPEDRARLGAEGPAQFDYRGLLHARGLTTRASYDAALAAGEVPLRAEFLKFQREAAAAFVRELGRVAAEEAGKPVPVGVNAWNLAPTQLATAHHADYFANEISHFGVEDLNPPRAYLLAEALGKPVFSTATGEDWIEVIKHGGGARVQRWIALAQAFGQHFMYAYRKWAFSAATGTRWYQTPIATYEPLTTFIVENAELFDGFEAAPQVGVLYSNAAEREKRSDVASILRALHDAHFSAGLAVAGDDWLRHELSREELERFELIVVPTGIELDPAQAAVLAAHEKSGRVVRWRGVDDLRARLKPWVDVRGPGRVWSVPRIRREGERRRISIHLLNLGPLGDGDRESSDPLTVTVTGKLASGTPLQEARWHVPGREPTHVELLSGPDGYNIQVPGVALWAVLELR